MSNAAAAMNTILRLLACPLEGEGEAEGGYFVYSRRGRRLSVGRVTVGY